MNTVYTDIQKLKKGNKVLFYGEVFEVTKDAKNFGDNQGGSEEAKITNTIWDIWGAPCKIISRTESDKHEVDWILYEYDWFQGNGNHGAGVLLIVE
jgi:hypothetical protein